MLTAVAMGSSRRSAALPELPTTLEAGIANSDYNFWVGMFAPSKTPRDIVDRLYKETAKALVAKAVRDGMVTLGAEPMLMPPADFDTYIRKEITTNSALVKAAGIASSSP
jgi:tripartite-type tricarboxylate transporter receptor subunit TctC